MSRYRVTYHRWGWPRVVEANGPALAVREAWRGSGWPALELWTMKETAPGAWEVTTPEGTYKVEVVR